MPFYLHYTHAGTRAYNIDVYLEIWTQNISGVGQDNMIAGQGPQEE